MSSPDHEEDLSKLSTMQLFELAEEIRQECWDKISEIAEEIELRLMQIAE
jgi:deoxyxylulose-5-phosphate synthase